jgi:MmyB-like transcription regulator ligand binding domain
LARLRRQIDLTGDSVLAGLSNEISDYPTIDGGKFDQRFATGEYDDIVVPLRLAVDGEVLSLISMTTVFGTPVDITLSEIAIEAFLPADAATAEALRRLACTG